MLPEVLSKGHMPCLPMAGVEASDKQPWGITHYHKYQSFQSAAYKHTGMHVH